MCLRCGAAEEQESAIAHGGVDKPRHGFLYIYAESSRLCPESSPKAPLELRTEGGKHSTAYRATHCFSCFPIGGFSPPEGRLARGFKPPAFSRFPFQSAVKSAESF
jgi:hypothetical protein